MRSGQLLSCLIFQDINLKETGHCEACHGLEDVSWRVQNLLACAQKEENFIEDSKLVCTWSEPSLS